ncbi:MAG: hypothetical protein DRI90_03085, partial [Deltaproteobacteria bacterium]
MKTTGNHELDDISGRLIRWAAAFGAMAFLVAAGACADGGVAFDDDDDTSTSTSGGGGGAGGGTGGSTSTSGTGGSTGPCEIDCATIETPQCQVSKCNVETKQCEVLADVDGAAC